MGAVAADQPGECSSRSSFFIPFMAFLTGVFWFVVAYISFTTRGNISFQRNLNCQAVAGGAVTPSFDRMVSVLTLVVTYDSHVRRTGRIYTIELVPGDSWRYWIWSVTRYRYCSTVVIVCTDSYTAYVLDLGLLGH
jgi:hypothetical protein